ncbi:MAG: leucine-rich repeat domain-containing protein [Lachnospiraceae bacterium]|nr:leucine-rich repeat domain-containing protein [Lachnospiraceae bacterium]
MITSFKRNTRLGKSVLGVVIGLLAFISGPVSAKADPGIPTTTIYTQGSSENFTLYSGEEIRSGTYSGKVELQGGVITGGTFTGEVVVGSGTTAGITGGDFYCTVQVYGIVNGGTFHGEAENNTIWVSVGGASSDIQDGTFECQVNLGEEAKISGGTFNGEVQSSFGTITGGSFNKYAGISGGTVSGGTFSRLQLFGVSKLSAQYNTTVTGGTLIAGTLEVYADQDMTTPVIRNLLVKRSEDWSSINVSKIPEEQFSQMFANGSDDTLVVTVTESPSRILTIGKMRAGALDKYTLHFDAAGGNGNMADTWGYKEGYLMLPANTFTKGSAQFEGWSDMPGGNKIFEDKASAYPYRWSVNIGENDRTLYALWSGGGAKPAGQDVTDERQTDASDTLPGYAYKPDSASKKAATVKIDETTTIGGKKYTVTKIAKDAFKNDKKVKKALLPASLKEIGDGAFAGCSNLSNVNLKKTGVEVIGKNAFKGTKLKSAELPASTTEVKSGAFANCKYLKTVKLGKNTTKIGVNAFKGSKVKTLYFKSAKVPSKKDIKGVKSLGKNATIKVPGKALSAYKKVLKAAGFKGTVKKG